VEKPIDLHSDFEDIWTPEEKARILEIKSRPNRKAPSTNFSGRRVMAKLLVEMTGMSDKEADDFIRRHRA